jgi:hypothetical protein
MYELYIILEEHKSLSGMFTTLSLPVNLIWAQIKGHMAEKNIAFKIADTEKVTHKAIDHMTILAWEDCVSHAENLQEVDFHNELLRYQVLDPIIVNTVEVLSKASSCECSDDD